MPDNSQKLKLRADLINILNKYRDKSEINNIELKKDIDYISELEDKNSVFKILLQEIISSEGIYCDICSIIAFEAIDGDVFADVAFNFLKDKKVADDKKFLIMSLMRQKGLNFNYRDIIDYIDNPEDLAHNGIKSFLSNAMFDPEVQIDLLDFYINIPKDEKINFLDNLKSEFSNDDLANAFSILAQLNLDNDELDIVFDVLINSNSPYALCGLEFILENSSFENKIKARIKRKIKKIKALNPNFKNDFLTKNSSIYKCFISFVDGKSNFSLVFSRKSNDGLIHTILFTVNIVQGITSCMGFCSIPEENFNSIIKRLFNDYVPIKINPVALKSLYLHYLVKADKNDIELPYELIVWKNMLNDVRAINFDISEFINSKLEITKLTKLKVMKFISSKIIDTWFYLYGENEYIDKIIDKMEELHCVDLDKINEIVSKTIDDNFIENKKFMREIQSRLLIQSYVASLAKLKLTSACAYSLCFKNPYTKMFLTSLLDKSIYYICASKLSELDEENIFKKDVPTKYTKDELELIMAQLEEKWL